MKTQEEYAHEIDEIVRRDVESCQSDWFKIDKEILSLTPLRNGQEAMKMENGGMELPV